MDFIGYFSIQRANLNFPRICMSAPVLTSIVPGAGPLHASAYFVRLYLPLKFQASPPIPLPELNLYLIPGLVTALLSGSSQDLPGTVTLSKKLRK